MHSKIRQQFPTLIFLLFFYYFNLILRKIKAMCDREYLHCKA